MSIYLPSGRRELNVKAISRRFQPEEGPSRGLLCDCETFANLRIAFVSSSSDNTIVNVTPEEDPNVTLARTRARLRTMRATSKLAPPPASTSCSPPTGGSSPMVSTHQPSSDSLAM